MAKDFTTGKIQEHDFITIYCDGACEPKNPGGIATIGWLICQTSNEKNVLVQECRVVADGEQGDENATNNYAEYCALGFALRWLKDSGWDGEELIVRADSQLLIKQVLGEWKCKSERLLPLRQRVWDLIDELGLEKMDEDTYAAICGCEPEIAESLGHDPYATPCVLIWVPREQNEVADALSKKAYWKYRKQQGDAKNAKVVTEKKEDSA
jgi:ribonuclease HI